MKDDAPKLYEDGVIIDEIELEELEEVVAPGRALLYWARPSGFAKRRGGSGTSHTLGWNADQEVFLTLPQSPLPSCCRVESVAASLSSFGSVAWCRPVRFDGQVQSDRRKFT